MEEEKIDALTSNPYFKRLYGVSQLGAIKYIYEKAKLYSRAEHCLFAAYLMREICKNLREKKDISAEDELNLVIASLLHDHHSTFSHSIESLIKFSKDSKWKNHKERSAWVIEKYFKKDIEEIGGDVKEIKK